MTAAVWAVIQYGAWAVAPSLLILGNRQRALGNVLHDLSHRNVSRRAEVNDLIARGLVAPLLFADFDHYRKAHLAHHMHLGHPQNDPDFMPSAGADRSCWRETFVANLFNPQLWFGTLAGDFAKPLRGFRRLYMALWWLGLLTCIGAAGGWYAAAAFLALWLTARASVFFLITLFREMCDHFGREPGGIFQFSRDITAGGVLGWLIHPKNNGYHLTHHLLPTVPYYHLPAAHQILLKLPQFQQQARVCSSYLRGPQAVVHA
ncbi:hypothetical protein GCM10028785_15470 [Hydrogenophaga soli]